MTNTKPSMKRSMQFAGVQAVFAAMIALVFAAASAQAAIASTAVSYPIVDTGQVACYDDDGAVITCPDEGEAFYGQDAQFSSNEFSFTDNNNGAVTDNVTNLMWQQSPDSGHYSWSQAVDACEASTLAGYDDWRLPSLKELFSISNFSEGWPYLDTTYFDLAESGEVTKDEQYWANNDYAGITVEGGSDAAFGVNHATGHIKAYAAQVGGPMGKRMRCVRGDEYGVNQFVDNGDSTITDEATGLMWMQDDSSEGMDWESALALAEEKNAENYLGYSDWRLPDVKELQSIVDYSRAPDATDPANEGPALDPLFNVSTITNEAGNADYPYYWSSTSALFRSGGDYYYAWYVAAGRAVNGEGLDFHGAGAVRFDTKVEGGPAGEDPERIYNYVRLVRDTETEQTPDESHFVYLPFISHTETEPEDEESTDDTDITDITYPIVDTDQELCYDNSEQLDCPVAGEAFYGQDAQIDGNAPDYTVNTTEDGDETVIDNVTGITWTKSPDLEGIGNNDGAITSDDKLSSGAAATACEALEYAGYTDWQLPNVKQLYSLMNFQGVDPTSDDTSSLRPFIDWDVFDFAYGSTQGERIIDSQYATTSLYTNDEGTEMMFGVNFADGRIKGYEEEFAGSDKTYFAMCIRGNTDYGENDFVDNGDGSITDNATGLMWAQDDSGSAYAEGFDYTTLDFLDEDGDGLLVPADADMNGAMTWEEALSYVQSLNEAEYLGYSDWRLPNVKEIHSLMDYSKTPAVDGVATIDSVFNSTAISNENGDTDYPFYWSGTTHATDGDSEYGVAGSYVAFGRAMGYSEELGYWIDVHGAGAQRSDEKAWDGGDYTTGDGPQNDAVRIYHYVRPVRDGATE